MYLLVIFESENVDPKIVTQTETLTETQTETPTETLTEIQTETPTETPTVMATATKGRRMGQIQRMTLLVQRSFGRTTTPMTRMLIL